MSKIIECDEGFITSIGKSDLSITDIKKSTVDCTQQTNEEKIEKVNQTYCGTCRAMKSKIKNLLDENSRLKELNKEASEIDRRRQKYDQERQDFIQRLLKTIKKLQLRSSELITSDSRSDSFSLTDRQKAIHMSSEELRSDNKQNSDKSLLRQSYENALKENVYLQKELDEIRNNFDTLIDQLSNKESERIQALEFQAKLHKEDYEIEKREKDNALREAKQLISENERLRKICTNYENKFEKLVELFRSTNLLSKNTLKHSSSHTEMAANNGPKFKTNSLPNGYRFKTNNSIEVNQIDEECNLSKDNSRIEEDLKETIECPNCEMSFPVEFQVQLLQHFENCQKV